MDNEKLTNNKIRNLIKNVISKVKKIIFLIVTISILIYSYNSLNHRSYNVSKEAMFQVSGQQTQEFIPIPIVTPKAIFTPTLEPTIEPTTEPTPESTLSPTEEPQVFIPNLLGMDETTAINACVQSGYKYSIEYYLGGNATVISQSPTSSESIEPGGSIAINIGISQSDFSNRLLALINEKRRASGLSDLSFSEQLNTACNILAQENVNSVDCTRPDGSHWSSVLWDNGIWLNSGTFTTRNNITSLNDANRRIKYASNKYGSGNLLTPSYTLIGMAFSSDNMLVIIIG